MTKISFSRVVFAVALLPLAFGVATVSAAPVVVNDNYIGAMPNDPSEVGHDVLGTESRFGVSQMSYDFTAGVLTVSIFSQYFDNVGISNTNLGDLFISTNGWSPFGPAPYLNDNAANGEAWEYALVMNDHGAKDPSGQGVSFLGHSGVANLYAVQNSNIVLANGPIIRAGQEVQYDPKQQQAVAQGTWSILDVIGSDYEELRYTINLASILGVGAANLGFHWTMSCANDVIEGGNPVPEPASMLLFASALGMGAAMKRRKLA